MIQPIAIEKYCDSLKDKIIFSTFNLATHIDGVGIKNLTPVPQINSFVMRKLFRKWREEMKKLRSPFFDYEHPEVKQALEDYMAALSFHINIEKDYFEVLLKEALHDSFDYLENPIFFLQDRVFEGMGNRIDTDEVRMRMRYFKLYPDEMASFLAHPKLQKPEIRLDELLGVLEMEFEDCDTVKEEKEFVAQLHEVVPNNFVSFGASKPIDDRDRQDVSPFVNMDKVHPEYQELHKPTMPKPAPKPDQKLEAEDSKNEQKQPKQIHDVYLEKMPKEDLSSELSPISNLQKGIKLHEKYYFVKELFGQDEPLYVEAITHIDELNTYDQAQDYLFDHFAQKYNWGEKQDALEQLFSLLNRRF